jgi:hypothetical protein
MLSTTASSPPPQEGDSIGSSFIGILESAYNSKTFLVIQVIIAIYCLVLIFNISFASLKLSLFRGRVRQFFTGTKAKPEQYEILEAMPGTMQLREINKKVTSNSASDWKIAVIEADKVFDKTLEKKGFAGESVGEKLKEMVPGDLPEVYEEVWEAHKIRNRIVHEPDFDITQSEARKIIGIYERAIKILL